MGGEIPHFSKSGTFFFSRHDENTEPCQRCFLILLCSKQQTSNNYALFMQSLLLWYQTLLQITFKREEESLAPSLLNIICRQNWYQSKSDYMDRAYMYWSKLVQYCTIVKNFTSFCTSSSNPSHCTSICYSRIHKVPVSLLLWQYGLSGLHGRDEKSDEFLAKN